MLYIIGLGLRGLSSLTMEGARTIECSSRIFFETYTSISPEGTIRELEEKFSRKVIPLNRSDIEEGNILIESSRKEDVSLIVTGDPLSATTHNQLRLDAMNAGVEVEIIENASIISVIPGKIGLFPYRMGPPVSLPFPQENFLPRSVCDKIFLNLKSGLHTIVLLDLRDGRTMYSHEALETLIRMEERYGVGAINLNSEVFSVTRVSQPGEKLIFDTVQNLIDLKLLESPAALVVPAELNHNESEFSARFNKRCTYFR